MTDMWSFTVLQQPGQPGVRGYGGRLMFYDADDKPMKVDGTLTVYAFDARSEDPATGRARTQIRISAERLAQALQRIQAGSLVQFLAAVGRGRGSGATDRARHAFREQEWRGLAVRPLAANSAGREAERQQRIGVKPALPR